VKAATGPLAIKNSGSTFRPRKLRSIWRPADLKKRIGFDLPMAIGILGAYGALQLKKSRPIPAGW